MENTLIVRVLPGVFEILASKRRPQSAFTSELLPAFDRPTKATSDWASSSLCAESTHAWNCAVLKTLLFIV
jgi:hypothetical protein